MGSAGALRKHFQWLSRTATGKLSADAYGRPFFCATEQSFNYNERENRSKTKREY